MENNIKLIEQSIEFLDNKDVWDRSLERICKCTRIAYRSSDPNSIEKNENLIKRLIFRGDSDKSPRHTSTLEHAQFTVILHCSRAIANEFVRHRHTAFTQESTRYVNFGKKDAEFIIPSTIIGDEDKISMYKQSCSRSFADYSIALSKGMLPQISRDMLPLGLSTTMAMTTNIAEWRSIFSLRCDSGAHPDARSIAFTILNVFNSFASWAFSDIYERFEKEKIPLCKYSFS